MKTMNNSMAADEGELIAALRRQYKRALDSALYEFQRAEKAVADLAAALVQEQEPVAYMAFAENGNIRVWAEKDNLGAREAAERMGVTLIPVYTYGKDFALKCLDTLTRYEEVDGWCEGVSMSNTGPYVKLEEVRAALSGKEPL